jgi:hypothetical protein
VRALRPFTVFVVCSWSCRVHTTRDHITIRLEMGRPRAVHANRDVGEIVGKVLDFGFTFVFGFVG